MEIGLKALITAFKFHESQHYLNNIKYQEVIFLKGRYTIAYQQDSMWHGSKPSSDQQSSAAPKEHEWRDLRIWHILGRDE